jgi:HEAT repeat protein
MMRGVPFGEEAPAVDVEFRVAISKVEARQIFAAFLQNKEAQAEGVAQKYLDDLLRHHLIQQNGEQVEFRHQMLQEYYVAEYLLAHWNQISEFEFKRDYLNYLKWTEAIRLMLGLIDSKKLVLQIVESALKLDLMLGARLAGNVKRDIEIPAVGLVSSLVAPLKFKIKLLGLTKSFAATPFLNLFLDNDEVSIRRETIKALGRIDDISIASSLRKLLEDQDEEIRWLAVYELANFNDELAIPILQEFLCVEKHHIKAIFAIEKIDRDKVIPSLGKTIVNISPEVRIKATTSLHLLVNKEYEGILPLLEAGLHDEDSRVRRSAVHALKDAGSEEALSILSNVWADEDMQVRNLVYTFLNEDVLKYLEHDIEEALLGNDSTLKKRAIEIITRTKLDSENITKALLNVAFFDLDFLLRNSASTALVINGNSIVVRSLGEILEEDDLETTQYSSKHSVAVTLLLQICDKESIPILTKVLLDRHESIVVRIFAIKALGEINDPSVIPILLENFENARKEFEISINSFEFEAIYLETILALTKLGAENPEDLIIAVLENHASSDVREDCVKALDKNFTEKAKTALIKALFDLNFSVRFSSALILANRKYADGIPVLIEALSSRNCIGLEDSTVCNKAIDALHELGEIVLSSLGIELENQDYQARKNARLVIGKINGDLENDFYSDILAGQSTSDLDKQIDTLTNNYDFIELCKLLSAADPDEAWKFGSALMKISQPEQLSCLYKSIVESDSNNIFTYVPNLISKIQNRCKFYNYDLTQSSKTVGQPLTSPQTQVTNIINNYDLGGANIGNWAENQYGTQQTTQIQPNPSQPPETPQ